eukprot:c19584_g1_i1 orf=154-2070(-)
MACFNTSRTDGTEGSLQRANSHTLKSLLAREQAPIPSPSIAKKIIETKMGFGTRKTLQARTSLLDTACHSLAKAKQRTLVSFPPSFYITSDTTLFPLPLPPGYKPSTNSRITAKSSSTSTKSTSIPTDSITVSSRITAKSSSTSTKSTSIPTDSITVSSRITAKSSSTSTKSTSIPTNSITKSSSIPTINMKVKASSKLSTKSTNSINTKSSSIPTITVKNTNNSTNNTKSSSSSTSTNNRIDVVSTSSSYSSDSSLSPCHPSSTSNTTFLSSCEDLTPSSSTSSSVFSAAPSSLSQSSSFSSSSTNSSDLQCNSLSHDIENENSFLTPLPPLSPHKLQVLGSPLKEFSPLELARACENFDDSYKLRDGAMGPIYKVFLPEENSVVAIARVATKFSRKKWKAQIQATAQLEHPNLSRVIGFSYERAKYTMMNGVEGMHVLNTGLVVYESIGNESLEEFLQDVEKGHSHIDWLTRLKIAIGLSEGLLFILEKMPSHVNYGGLTMDNIRVDLSFNAKLLDFNLASTIDEQKGKKSCEVVHDLGNVLFQIFDFISYPQYGEAQGVEARSQKGNAYPPKEAKVVINLAARCLLSEASLRPSIRQVARVLRGIEHKQHVAKVSMKHSKSSIVRRKKIVSFGEM